MSQKIAIELNSGRQIMATQVRLFPKEKINEIISLRAKGQEELGGYSSGLDFIGSPSWVIAGSATLGLLESIVSNAKVKKGLELLKEAAAKREAMENSGIFFEIEAIDGIKDPNPNRWQAVQQIKKNIDFDAMTMSKKSQLLQQYKLSSQDLKNGEAIVTIKKAFIHDESEFVTLNGECGLIAIRWQSVASYKFI